jgi:predicted methyltransferase MtxX (methanogen marker protein 4)
MRRQSDEGGRRNERGLHMQQQFTDLLVDVLLDEGFTVEEALRLIQLQERYEERLATEETNHHRFIRWLVEHGRISDWF